MDSDDIELNPEGRLKSPADSMETECAPSLEAETAKGDVHDQQMDGEVDKGNGEPSREEEGSPHEEQSHPHEIESHDDSQSKNEERSHPHEVSHSDEEDGHLQEESHSPPDESRSQNEGNHLGEGEKSHSPGAESPSENEESLHLHEEDSHSLHEESHTHDGESHASPKESPSQNEESLLLHEEDSHSLHAESHTHDGESHALLKESPSQNEESLLLEEESHSPHERRQSTQSQNEDLLNSEAESHPHEESPPHEDADKRTEEDMETHEVHSEDEGHAGLTDQARDKDDHESGLTFDVEKQTEDEEQTKSPELEKASDAVLDSLGESMDTALVIDDDDDDDEETVVNTVQSSTPCLASPGVNSVPVVTCSLTASSNGQQPKPTDDDEIEFSAESSIDITPAQNGTATGEDDCIVDRHHVPRSLAVVGCKITMYERKGLVFIREGKTGLCGMVYTVLKTGENGTQQVVEKEYLCNFCQKRLKNMDALQKHMVNHIFGCSMCEKKFLTHIELVRHTYENHPSCARVLAGFAYLDPKHREENLRDTESFDSKMRAVDVAPSVLAPLPKPSLNVRVIRPGTATAGPTLVTSQQIHRPGPRGRVAGTTALVYACDLCSFKTKDSAIMLRHTKSHPAGEMINAARLAATGAGMPALYGCPKCHVKTDSAKKMVEHVETSHASYLRTLNQGSASPRAPYILIPNTAGTVPPGQSLLTVSSSAMTRTVPSTLVNSVPTSSMSSSYQQKVLTAAARAIGRDPSDFRAIVQHSPASTPNQFKTTVLLQPVTNFSKTGGGPRTAYSIVQSTTATSALGASPLLSTSSSMLRCSTPASSPAKWKCQYCPMMVGQRDVMVAHVKQAHPLEKQVILKIGPRLPEPPTNTIDLTATPDVPVTQAAPTTQKPPEASSNSKIMLLKSNSSRSPRGRIPTLANLCVHMLNTQSRAMARHNKKAVKIQYRDHLGKKRGLMITIANRHGKEPSDQSLVRFYVESAKHFECSLCQKAINSVLTMREHLLTKHFLRESWYCSYCSFNSKERNDLLLHILDNHKDLKGVLPELINARKYMLPPKGAPLLKVVNRLLRGPRSVRQNNMLQSAKSMWQCSFCTRRSIFRGELAVHVRLVHPQEPENTVFQRWSRPRLRPREAKRGQKLAVHLVRLNDMERIPRLQGLMSRDAEFDPLMTELDIDDEEDSSTVRSTYVQPVEAEEPPQHKGPAKPYRCPHCAIRPTAAPIRVKKHIRAIHKGMESTMIWLDAESVWKRLFFCTGTDCHYRTSDVNNFMSHIMENADHRIPELKLPAEVQQLITDCDLQGTLDLLTATAQEPEKAEETPKILEDKSNLNQPKVNGSEGRLASRAKRKRSMPVNGYQEREEDDMESELAPQRPQTQAKRRIRQRTDHGKSNRCWLGDHIDGWDMTDTPLICMQASCGRLPMGYDDMKIHMAASHPMLPIARNPSAEGKEPSRVYICVKTGCNFATYFMEHFQFHLSVKHSKPPNECSASLRNLITQHRKDVPQELPKEEPKVPEPIPAPLLLVPTLEPAPPLSGVPLSRKRKFGPDVDSDDENDTDYQPYVKNSQASKAKKRPTRRSGRQPTGSSEQDSLDSHGEGSLDASFMPSLEAEETLPPSPIPEQQPVPKPVMKSAPRSILAPRSPRLELTVPFKPPPKEKLPPPPVEKPKPIVQDPKPVVKEPQPATEQPPPLPPPPPPPPPKLDSPERRPPSPTTNTEEKTQIAGKDLPELRYLCRVDCGSAFKTMVDIQMHQYYTDHGRIGPEGYVCRDLVCRMQRKKQYIFYCSNFVCTFVCKKLTELSKHHANCKHAGSKPPPQPSETEPPALEPSSKEPCPAVNLDPPASNDKEKDDSNKMYQCSFCSYITTSQDIIKKHMADEHRNSSHSYTTITSSGDGNLQVCSEPKTTLPTPPEPEVKETPKVPASPQKEKAQDSEKKKKADDSSDSSSDDSDDSSDDDDDDDSSDDSDSSDDDDSDDSDDSSDDDTKSEKSKTGPPVLAPVQSSS